MSVARGPPENIVDAWQEFTGTLQELVIPGAKFQVGQRQRQLGVNETNMIFALLNNAIAHRQLPNEFHISFMVFPNA